MGNAAGVSVIAGGANHGSVVGAECRRGDDNGHGRPAAGFAQWAVGGDPATEDEIAHTIKVMGGEDWEKGKTQEDEEDLSCIISVAIFLCCCVGTAITTAST